MGDISLGKNAKSGQVCANQLQQGGVKKEQLKNKKLELLFDAADKNKDGILDKQEAEDLLKTLNSDNNDEISSKEAKEFLKNSQIKDLKKEDLYEFLTELTQASENIKSSTYTVDDAGKKTVSITYKDDTQEVINPDASKEVTTVQNGETVVRRYNKGSKTPAAETRTTDTETIVTEFDADGKPVQQTITDKAGSSVKTIKYEDGKPQSSQVKFGITTEYYSYDENGKEIKTSMTENEGIEAKERRTTYEYGENNTVTENITEPGKTSVRVLQDGVLQTENIKEDNRTIERKLKDGNLESETVTEEDKTIKTTIAENGTKTVRTELKDETATEVVTRQNGDQITTKFNASGKKLTQTVTKNGQTYNVKYDGKGNTYVVVQNAETPGSIAQKFGIKEKTLLAMNKHNRDELGNNYFSVGATIKVPGELNADDKRIANRKSSAAAKNAYVTSGGAAREAAANEEVKNRKNITWTEKKNDTFEQIARDLFKNEGIKNPTDLQLSKRIKDLKKDNPDLKDGQLKGKKITAGVSQEKYDEIQKAEQNRKTQEAAKQDAVVQKKSAAQIVADLKDAIDGWNDLDKIQKTIARIDNPVEMAEVNRLLQNMGYKADDLYSPIEKFIYEENSHSSVHMYNSSDYLEKQVQKWISNGTLKGKDAINAQARMAARVIFDAGDGFGTDCDKTKKGIYMIKSPTGNKADAAAVYKKVNEIVSRHATFYGLGKASKNLADYLDGEMWDGEVKYLNGILAQNNAIQGKQKAQAVHDLVEEAVSGAGTDIEYLQQAIMAIDSPQDMEAIEAKLKEYCQKKGIKPQIAGQSYLQAILYDECDTFMGISTDHKEIRKFNEMLIKQGAYTPEQAVKIRAEQAALELLDGGFSNAQDAVAQIKDPKVLAKMNELLKTKNYAGIDGFLNKKFSSQTDRDLIKAELAANKLLSDNDAASVALRLVQNADFDTRAKGLAAIRTSAQAQAVDKALKAKGSSLAKVMEKFNAEKSEYKTKAAIWDGIASFVGLAGGSIAEHISDQYRENTDVSNNLYIEADKPANITPEQKQAYAMTVKTLEDKLEKMKEDYQNALDSQGVVSGAVNEFCSIYNIGTTRDDIEARIEHDTETVRLLKMASEGKLQKLVNGKPVNVSFEEVYKERQSEFVTANAASVSGIKNAIKPKEVTTFNQQKVEQVSQQANKLVAMEGAKDLISDSWSELNTALNSKDNKRLSTAIYSSLDKLSQMTGKKLSLEGLGYQLKNGIIVDKNGKSVSAAELQNVANQIKQGLSDTSKLLLGTSIPMNAKSDDVNSLLEKGYESKKEEFKQEYRDAFGQDCPDEMIDSYLSTINNGVMAVNIVTSVGAVILAPLTGGGSLAVFAAAAGTTLAVQGLEQSTDANGWTNSEWTDTAANACWNGALAAVGMKVGMLADGAAQGSLLTKSANLVKKIAPNMDPAKAKVVSTILARAEATFGEVASDVASDLVQTYCMEGEFNPDTFAMNLVMSLAGNAAGHIKGAIDDIHLGKTSVDIDASGTHVRSGDVDTKIKDAGGIVDDGTIKAAEHGVVIDNTSVKSSSTSAKVNSGASAEVKANVAKAQAEIKGKVDQILTNKNAEHFLKNAPNFADTMDEFKLTLELVDDVEVLNHINSLNLNNFKDLQEAIDLVDAINTFDGKYTSIKTSGHNGYTWVDYQSLPDSQKSSFMKFLKETDPKAYEALASGQKVEISSDKLKAFNNSRQSAVFSNDASMLEKTYNLKKYIDEHPYSNMSDHLYNLYLDKYSQSGAPDAIVDKCKELNTKYGTRVILGSDIAEASEVLDFIDEELHLWNTVSNGQVKVPPSFDFNSFNKEWFDKTSAYGQGTAAAYADASGSLAFSKTSEHTVQYALRHEMTHTNAGKSYKITQAVIDDIMPKKTVIQNGKQVQVPDMSRAKYVDEFRKAGIPERHIPYAYNDIDEFIAVAAEGNMSKYSPEFKSLLVDMGMPEYMFKLDDPAATLPSKAQNSSEAPVARTKSENISRRAIAEEAPSSASFLNEKETKYFAKYTKFPEASTEVLNSIASRIKNGEVPSRDMLESVIDDVSAKTGVSPKDLERDFGRGMKVLDSDWQKLENAFKKSQEQILADIDNGKSIASNLDSFKEKRGLLSDAEIEVKQEAAAKAQHEAQIKAEQEAQLKAQQEADLKAQQEAKVKAEQDARAQRQKILDENADKYPEVVNETSFRDDETAAKLITLMEDYDLKMGYSDFDSTEIYRKIHQAGITNDADADIAFKKIKERFHSDVIAQETKVSQLQDKYRFFSKEESIAHSDKVIASIKEKAANGGKLTLEDIDNMISDDLYDVRDFDRIKQCVFDDKSIKGILNDNLHLDVYSNPKYQEFESGIPTAMEILDEISAEAKNGNEITLELIQKHIDAKDAKLRADGSYVSSESLWILQDVLRYDEVLGPQCKTFVEDIVDGGFIPDVAPVKEASHRSIAAEEMDNRTVRSQEADTQNRARSAYGLMNPYEVRVGQMQKGAGYVLNNDRLPRLQLPGGEAIDLNSPEYAKQLLGLREGQQIVIGREGNIPTNPNNMNVSRHHAVIYKENGQLKISDISSNGTYIATDASNVLTANLEPGRMMQNTCYKLSENSLPKVTLANSQTLDLQDYKNRIVSLGEGQYLTIGREGDIQVPGDTVSGQHLVIYRSNGQLRIKDISLNGTTIEKSTHGILSRIKDKINNIGGSSSRVGNLTPRESATLSKFRNNKLVAQAASNPAEVKRIAKRLNNILNDPKIVSPELKNAIENGRHTLSAREGSLNCSVDSNIMDDIARLATEGDYIRKFKGYPSMQNVMANTPVGEVANVNGVLYVNNGQTMQRLNMSEKTFRKLFPPVERFSTHQGAVGTCYLVSTLERLYSSPLGRAKIYSLIGEDANGIYTTTFNGGGKKDYFRRWDRFNKHIQEKTGLALIEQGYCKNSRHEALEFNPRETRIMQVNAGGWSEQAMYGLIGEYPTVIRYDESSIANSIRNFANNNTIVMNAGTKSKAGLTDRDALAKQYNVFAGHEYSIKGYDASTDCVIISNPWHSGITTKIPVSDFVKFFSEVSFVKLA